MKIFKTFKVLLVLTFLYGTAYAATISGTSSPALNVTYTYSVNPGFQVFMPVWSSSGATIVSTSVSGSLYYVDIKWSTSGSKTLYFKNGSTTVASKSVTVTVTAPSSPPAPTGASSVCGSSITLTRSGTPPTDVTWYWQGKTSNGTSTSKGSGSTYSANQGSGNYYIRAYSSNGGWGGQSYKAVTINSVPSKPPTPSVTQNCGNTVLTRANPPSGYTYYWQSSSSGTSTSGSAQTQTKTRTSGTVYYLRSRKNSTGCWSSARSVSYSINSVPSTPPTPSVTQNCGSTALIRANPPSGYTYYWQSSSSGTSTSSSSQTKTRTSGTVYYLRSRNNSTGCWSSARSVSYTVLAVPDVPPVPTVTNVCGSTYLQTLAAPSGQTYYWQSSSSGTSTSNSAATITRTSGTTYYLRARNNITECWSNARTVGYFVQAIPALPTSPTITNNCESTDLAMPTAPSGYTYYWQSSSTGSSTSDVSAAKTRTSGTKYYLRSRNNSTLCWSSVLTVSYTINSNPSAPPVPSITNNCGNTVLTRATPPSGETYYWQSTLLGTSTSSSATTKTFTSGTEYYIRSRNNSTGCWSTAATANYVINEVPAMPPVPAVANTCGSSLLSRAAPPAGHTYYWQSAASGESTTNSSVNLTLYSGTTHYLRSQHDLSQCWSDAQSVSYTFDPIPELASGNGNSRCEAGNITISATPGADGDNIRWYAAASGGSILHTGVNYPLINLATTTTYYAASFNNAALCEDTDRHPVTATIHSLPTVNAGTDLQAFITNSITLSGESPTGGSWSGAGVSGSSFSAITAGTGNHTIAYSYTDGSGCNNTDTRVIEVLASPIVTPSGVVKLEIGGSVTLSVTSGYNSYQWKKDGVNISGATSDSYVVTELGAYKVVVTTTSNLTWESSEATVVRGFASDQNYVMAWSFKQAGIDPDNIPEDVTKVGRQVNYVDGFGRTIQSVAWQASPGANPQDLIQPVDYDQYGRVIHDYLPYAKGSGGLLDTDFADAGHANYTTSQQYLTYNDAGTTVANDTRPYTQKSYDSSPLNRITEQYGPGQAWFTNSKSVKFAYLSNTKTGSNSCTTGCDDVLAWDVVSDAPVSSLYEANELTKNITTDEEGHQVIEFTDKQGRIVLKKVETGEGTHPWAQTYYVYDEYGDLRFVLPPMIFEGNTTIESTELDDYAFQYKYDSRKRMTEKKVPGAGWVSMVYDDKDRLVMTQDGVQRNSAEWTFTKYDQLNRPVLTGIYNHGSALTQAAATDVVDQFYIAAASNSDEWYEARGPAVQGYTNQSFPKVSIVNDYLTATYYDDYAWNTDVNFNYSDPLLAHTFNGVAYSTEATEHTDVKGQVTGGQVKNLATNTWLKSVTYYDDRYRVIQSVGDNNIGGIDKASNLYDFTGKVLRTLSVHDDGTNSTSIRRIFDYDHADRLLTVKHKIGTEAEITILENEYNIIGELVGKKLHSTNGTDFEQSVDYRYNIRGWLTKINDPNVADPNKYFSMQLKYDEVDQYNGNIGATSWKNPFESATNSYDYSYDPMNRIKTALYATTATSGMDFDVTGIDYDANGNILTLQRNGNHDDQAAQLFDDLDYAYTGNRLIKVTDASGKDTGFKDGADVANEYLYDANGNMIEDKNKGIDSIAYNHLNLPVRIEMNADGTNRIEYIYDAAGIKMAQLVYGADTLTKRTDYQGAFIYEDSVLQFIQHEEGRVIPVIASGSAAISSFDYQYHLKDHLGNVRATFKTSIDTDTYLATLESDSASVEEQYFYNLDSVRTTFASANHTTSGDETAALNNSDMVGPAISLRVLPGDTVDMEVWAYYEGGSGYNSQVTLASFISSLAATFGGSSGAGGESGAIFDGIDDALTAGAGGIGGSGNDAVPAAYLSYILFDDNFNEIQNGYQEISTSASFNHERLFLDDITFDQAGYLYIYTSMQSDVAIPVYFDDLKITHKHSPIVSKDDYYPFGLTFGGYSRPASVEQNFKYNGKEEQDAHGLNTIDYGWRQYDAALGRFNVIDAFSDKYFDFTPYQYGANNPIKYIDYQGDSLMIFKNGEYVETVDDGNKETTGFNQLSETDEDGNETFTGGGHFEFNDIEADKEALVSGEMTVEQKSNDDMENALDQSGVNYLENKLDPFFVYRESRFQHSGGKRARLDFWAADDFITDNVLYVTKSKSGGAMGYNPSDFGNFMWGMAGKRLGYPLMILRLGAHFNNMMNGEEDNKWNKKYKHQLLDAPADQRAIQNGYNFNKD